MKSMESKTQVFLRLSKKKLNVFDVVFLYRLLLTIPYDDITYVKLFLDNYYDIQSMPLNFYQMFLYYVHSNQYKELFDILFSKNIYALIDFLIHDNESVLNAADLLDPKDYFELPNKYIKNILELLINLDIRNNQIPIKKLLEGNHQWLLKRPNHNTLEEYKMIAIKMFYAIGLENAIDILSGKYGAIDYEMIYYLFGNLNIKKSAKENNDILREFLFNNKKDPNNIFRQMIEGKLTELFINFDYFYNSLDYFISKLGTKFSKEKVIILLQERFLSPILENPEVSGDILKDMILSYRHKYDITDSEAEILEKNMRAYNSKLKKKTKSSIISTDIPMIDHFIFELIPLNDVRNLVMGYRAGNCFRINGEAFLLFSNFLSNPHMRILSISTKEHKDFGMVLLMRNGNVLIAQGIELSKRIPDQVSKEEIYNATRKALKYIMDQMNKDDDEIVVNIIGLSNANTANYNHSTLPFIINPILDNEHQFYNGIDNYQGLLDLKEGKTLNDIKLFSPQKFYCENSDKILCRRGKANYNDITYREIEKILISLRYAKFKITPTEEMVHYYSDLAKKTEAYTVCTLSWYIRVFTDGSIDSFNSSDNPEVIAQYNSELEKITKNVEINILNTLHR